MSLPESFVGSVAPRQRIPAFAAESVSTHFRLKHDFMSSEANAQGLKGDAQTVRLRTTSAVRRLDALFSAGYALNTCSPVHEVSRRAVVEHPSQHRLPTGVGQPGRCTLRPPADRCPSRKFRTFDGQAIVPWARVRERGMDLPPPHPVHSLLGFCVQTRCPTGNRATLGQTQRRLEGEPIDDTQRRKYIGHNYDHQRRPPK